MAREKESLTRRIAVTALIVILMPIIIPFAVAVLVFYWLHRMTLYGLIWLLWLPKGKDVLLVKDWKRGDTEPVTRLREELSGSL